MPKRRTDRNHHPRLIAGSIVGKARPDIRHLHGVIECIFGTGKPISSAASRRSGRGAGTLKGPPLSLRLNGRQAAFESHDRDQAVKVVGKLVLHGDLRKALPEISIVAHDREVDQVGMRGHDRRPIHARRQRRPIVVRRVFDVR